MNGKITVIFTQKQWEEVFYAIMVAETKAQKEKNNKLYGILLRAEEAMKIGKDRQDEYTEANDFGTLPRFPWDHQDTAVIFLYHAKSSLR